jgi:hypothetical protein
MVDKAVSRAVDELAIPWNGRWAFFERASGLVFINASLQQWEILVREASEQRLRRTSVSLLERVHHEFYHYLQFFGCAYMTTVCAEHYEVIRKTAPFPFTPETFSAFFARPTVRAEGLRAIARKLRAIGRSGLSPLHIVEGCAALYQYLAKVSNPLHGQYLLNLRESPDEDLYGRFYHAVALRLTNRALLEALFIGACALEFADPPSAIDEILALNTTLDPLRADDDLARRREYLIGSAGRRQEHLGTAYALAAEEAVYHPLLTKPWIFEEADDWEAAITTALAGRRANTMADCLRHAPVILRGVVHCPPKHRGKALNDVEIQTWVDLARVSLHLGSGPSEDDHV